MSAVTDPSSILRDAGWVDVRAEPHDPEAFYRSCRFIRLGDHFRTRIIARAKPISEPVSLRLYRRLITTRGKHCHGEVEALLARHGEYLLDISLASTLVAALLTKQRTGHVGGLDVAGSMAMMYLPDCVIRFCWQHPERKWFLDADARYKIPCAPGDRILSPV